MASKYGPTFIRGARAANKIRRTYRRYRRKRQAFSKSRIGEPVGTSSSKQYHIASDQIQFATRSLEFLLLTDFPKQTSAQEVNARERDIVNCRGIRICMLFRNLVANALFLNVAVVYKKDNGTPDTDNFFRSKTLNTRSQNFDTTLTGLEFHCLPINTDEYVILRHKRYKLLQKSNGVNAGNEQDNRGSSMLNLKWYIKMRRQFRFDDFNPRPIDGAVHLVYWCDTCISGGGSPSSPLACELTRSVVTYAREPQAVYR